MIEAIDPRVDMHIADLSQRESADIDPSSFTNARF